MSCFHLPLACLVALLATFGSAHASCWRDDALVNMAWRLAEQRFPLVTQRMPTVLMCSGDEFPPNVGGDYNSGAHRIRVPNWTQPHQLSMVVAHELAHAEVYLSGADGGADGHGPGWVAAMDRAGLGHEVHRVAQYSGVAAAALAQRGYGGPTNGRGDLGAWGGAATLPPTAPCGCRAAPTPQPAAPIAAPRFCRMMMAPIHIQGAIVMQPRMVCTPG